MAVMLAVLATLMVAGCGDKPTQKGAKKAANALSDYYYKDWKPPSGDWQIQKVAIAKDYTVNVDTKIATKTLSKAIMERSKMEQMEIARLACPNINEKIWDTVGKTQPVNIRLSGAAGHIINSLCMRPGEEEK